MYQYILIFVFSSILFFNCSNAQALRGDWEIVEIDNVKIVEHCFSAVKAGSTIRISSNTLFLDGDKQIEINLENFDTDSTLILTGDSPWGCEFKMIEYSNGIMTFNDHLWSELPQPNTFDNSDETHKQTSSNLEIEPNYSFKLKKLN